MPSIDWHTMQWWVYLALLVAVAWFLGARLARRSRRKAVLIGGPMPRGEPSESFDDEESPRAADTAEGPVEPAAGLGSAAPPRGDEHHGDELAAEWPTASTPREATTDRAPPPISPRIGSAPPIETVPPDPGLPVLPVGAALVPVYFATSRRSTASTRPEERYGPERGELSYGRADVSIPPGHRPGRLESPLRVFSFRLSPDPARHVMLQRVVEYPTVAVWRLAMAEALGQASSPDVFVFIHGYNTSFADAIRRTAQLGTDLDFQGVKFAYAWPSRATEAAYPADESTSAWVERDLTTVLQELAALPGLRALHVVAHSMGSRPLMETLKTFADRGEPPSIGELILAAPDLDAPYFHDVLAPAVRRQAARVSLYASARDRALEASVKFHRVQRAGWSLPTPVVALGVDTIDASLVDTSWLGHGYFADTKQVIDDLFMLVRHRLEPPERNLRPVAIPAGTYWRLP